MRTCLVSVVALVHPTMSTYGNGQCGQVCHRERYVHPISVNIFHMHSLTCTDHLFLMPTRPYARPDRRSTTPAMPIAGVIVGGIGKASGSRSAVPDRSVQSFTIFRFPYRC